jgi:hypothetical protein
MEAVMGNVFIFVTDGIGSAVDQARTAAGDKDVQVAGGASAVQQTLQAGLLDEMQTHVVPVLLGGGIPLFGDLGPQRPKLEGEDPAAVVAPVGRGGRPPRARGVRRGLRAPPRHEAGRARDRRAHRAAVPRPAEPAAARRPHDGPRWNRGRRAGFPPAFV